MAEKVVIGNAELWHGDCRDVLPLLPQCLRFGGLITDPPFGVGFKYESHDDSEHGYIEWLWPLIEAAESKCSTGAPIFIWQSGTNMRRFAEWFPREWRIFVAAKNFVQMRPTAMQWSWDPVLCWWIPGAKPWAAGTASRDFVISNTAPIVASPWNIEKGHPCPRPLDLLVHIIGQWVQPGTTVLDPFMGSGTAGVASATLGRGFIGIERERKYFDIACERISRAQAQGTLLLPDEPRQHEQEKLL
jgi:site-specific DNA-methyltransferase (adenine-specific)